LISQRKQIGNNSAAIDDKSQKVIINENMLASAVGNPQVQKKRKNIKAK
jgi:hypothetical protein